MSMNEIYETLQGISLSDISAVLSRLDESGHALTQAEIIGLAAAAVMAGGQLVVGMHLQGEAFAGVDELDQDGKFQSVAFVYLVADQIAHVDFRQLLQVVGFQEAVGGYRQVAPHAGDLPAFADAVGGCGQSAGNFLAGCGQTVSSPDGGLEYRLEFQRIKHCPSCRARSCGQPAQCVSFDKFTKISQKPATGRSFRRRGCRRYPCPAVMCRNGWYGEGRFFYLNQNE